MILHPEFEAELADLPAEVVGKLEGMIDKLRMVGPTLGRPDVDTLHGSRFANMKELRFKTMDGEWRAAFAFDPLRRAIVLVADDKSGVAQRRFYKGLLARADERFATWLEAVR